jgi:hypothetical protein
VCRPKEPDLGEPRLPRPSIASPTSKQLLGWLLALTLPPLALVLTALLAPHVPIADTPLLGAAALLAFACVSAEVLLAAAQVPPLAPRFLWLVAAPVAFTALVIGTGDLLPSIALAAIVTASLLTLGTLIGSVVGSAIENVGHLVVVAIVSAGVDAVSVLHPRGPTAQIVEVQAAVSVLILPWPILGTDRIEPILGVGDIAFAALYLVATRRHGLSVRRTVIALGLGLAVTLAIVLATGVGIPALPFLGAAVVAAHPEARRLPKEDRAKAAWGLLAIGVLFAVLFAALSASG